MIQWVLFPLALLAFESVGVRYWNFVFSLPVRWLCLGMLLVGVVLRGGIRDIFFGRASICLLVYLGWCVFTVAWSEMPELSLLKAGALILLVLAFVPAGQRWTYTNPTLGYLFPVVVLTLFAGLFDRGADQGAGNIEFYAGLTGNPNYLGALAAMSVPYGLWKVRDVRSRGIRRFVWVGVAVALYGVLLLSASRASLLCTLSVTAWFVAALNPGKRVIIVGVAGVLGVATLIAAPAVKSALYERFVMKGSTEESGGAFVSRREVWAESYEQALKGGVLGGGYGVTIGDTGSNFSTGGLALTVKGYGREKGNTQLAVWEETGLIGLFLYSCLIAAIILELGSGWRRLKDRDSKVQLALLLGAIIGFLVQSVFEAWWVAPGSAEAAYFWATLGAAYGTLRRGTVIQVVALGRSRPSSTSSRMHMRPKGRSFPAAS